MAVKTIDTVRLSCCRAATATELKGKISGAFTQLAYRPLVEDRAMEAWYHASIA
jgi:hypothetical protein